MLTIEAGPLTPRPHSLTASFDAENKIAADPGTVQRMLWAEGLIYDIRDTRRTDIFSLALCPNFAKDSDLILVQPPNVYAPHSMRHLAHGYRSRSGLQKLREDDAERCGDCSGQRWAWIAGLPV